MAKLSGTGPLKKALDSDIKIKRVKHFVLQATDLLEKEVQLNAEPNVIFVKGYSEGHIRDTSKGELKDDGLTGIVGTTMEYAPYVEYGTRYMNAEPFMKPAVEKVGPSFLKMVREALKS